VKRSFIIVALIALVIAATASAKSEKPWYLHSPGKSGHYVCNRDAKGALSSFVSKAACKAAIPTVNDGGGGDDNGGGNTTPPVAGASSPQSVFLCYSSFQTIPGVWTLADAATLVSLGYTEAEAVAGNVDGGINVGDYHLVCNASGADTGFAVGDNGDLYGPDYGPANEELGFYALYA
jgi:hypothetical protein